MSKIFEVLLFDSLAFTLVLSFGNVVAPTREDGGQLHGSYLARGRVPRTSCFGKLSFGYGL